MELRFRLALVALLYLACVTFSVLVGRVGGWDPLGILFTLGAVAVLGSVLYVRMGGTTPRRMRPREDSVWWHWVPRMVVDESRFEERRWEIAVGMTLFAFGLALWATVLLLYRVVGARPFMP